MENNLKHSCILSSIIWSVYLIFLFVFTIFIMFKCEQCPSVFIAKRNLTTHQNKHVGVRFPCTVCEKSFISKSNLKRHLKTFMVCIFIFSLININLYLIFLFFFFTGVCKCTALSQTYTRSIRWSSSKRLFTDCFWNHSTGCPSGSIECGIRRIILWRRRRHLYGGLGRIRKSRFGRYYHRLVLFLIL